MTAQPGWARQQGTLATELRLSGHGLHTGRRVNVHISPAPLVPGDRVPAHARGARGG